MKLLVINGNMTQAITDVCANAAREVASPGTEVVSATGTFGPQVIGSRSENALAQHGMLELAAKHAPGCDAVVIAVSMDTGLPALRELLSIPVVGMTEAALLTLGIKLGIPEDLRAFRESRPRRGAVPFASEHKFMCCVHADGRGGLRLHVKGAPDRVLACCQDQVFAALLDCGCDALCVELAPLNDGVRCGLVPRGSSN